MSAPTYMATLPARRFVVKAQSSELLEMLGLITDDGGVPPDDTNEYTFYSNSSVKSPGPKHADGPVTRPRRSRSTVPPGLATLQPIEEQPEPKKVKARKPRPKPEPKELQPCGTYAAYSRHRREGMTLEEIKAADAACYEASLGYGRTRKSSERAKKREQAERQRLLAAGVNPESARVLADAAR